MMNLLVKIALTQWTNAVNLTFINNNNNNFYFRQWSLWIEKKLCIIKYRLKV